MIQTATRKRKLEQFYSSKGTQMLIKNLSIKKAPSLGGYTGKFS